MASQRLAEVSAHTSLEAISSNEDTTFNDHIQYLTQSKSKLSSFEGKTAFHHGGHRGPRRSAETNYNITSQIEAIDNSEGTRLKHTTQYQLSLKPNQKM